MEINWTLIIICVIFAIILIVYLFRRNLKDKKEVEKFFNENEETQVRQNTDEDEF